MTPWRIVCDIGGTNVRIARAAAAQKISDIVVLPTQSCASVANTLRDYAGRFRDGDAPQGVAIAAAGPVDDGRVELTNHPMSIDAAEIRAAFDNIPVRLLNDLEAVAWSLPWLQPEQLKVVRSPASPLRGPQLVINIGTGFGGAMIVQTGNAWHGIACEPGHMRLAGGFAGESAALLATTSIEDVISGLALARPRGVTLLGADANAPLVPGEPPASLFAQPRFNTNFSALLGQVCGDLLLACGAWGGVSFCGSVATAWLREPDLQAFLTAFEAKGPMAPRMARVGINQILAPHPALIGLAAIPLD